MEQKATLITARRETAYYRLGTENRRKLLLVHGNVTSSAFFFPTMYALAKHFDVAALDLNGFGDTARTPIYSPTALTDWAEDVHSLAQAFQWERYSVVGWSLGGGVVMRLMTLHPRALQHVVLLAPMSPYGFGGTWGEDGQLYDGRGWGAPGGFANPLYLQKLVEKDRSEDPVAGRRVLEKSLFADGFTVSGEWQELYLDELFKIPVEPDYYPGDYEQLPDFPFVLPGTRGISNALAPQWANVSGIVDITPKPPVLWMRGDRDKLVSDQSGGDLAVLGMLGYIPGYPGEAAFPPQPMLAQTRHVLNRYAANGGTYQELVMAGCSHAPHLEKPDEFVDALHNFIT